MAGSEFHKPVEARSARAVWEIPGEHFDSPRTGLLKIAESAETCADSAAASYRCVD
jgi:hypothetical protein